MSLWRRSDLVHVPIEEYHRLKHVEAAAMNVFTLLVDLLAGERNHGTLEMNDNYSGAMILTAMGELGNMLGAHPDTGKFSPKNLV